jgi:hypothetical protein
MPNLFISPDVEAHIGVEAARRLRARHDLATVACVDCRNTIGRGMAAAIVLHVVDSRTEPDQVLLAHSSCRRSGVYPLTAEELDEMRQRWEVRPEEIGTSRVSATAGLLPSAMGQDRAVLLVTLPEITTVTPAGDNVDLATTYLLERGWHLPTRLGTPPAPPAEPWRLRYQMPSAGEVYGGALTLLSPEEEVAWWPGIVADRLWMKHLFDTGRCEVYVITGPRPEDNIFDLATLRGAIREGRAAAALVDADFLDDLGRSAQAVYEDVSARLLLAQAGASRASRTRRHR